MGVSESSVVVAPDSSGKAIRNVSFTTLVNGVPTVVQMQVLGGIADLQGKILDLDIKSTLERMLVQQQRTADMFEMLLDGGAGAAAATGFVGRSVLGPASSGLTIVPGMSDAFGRQVMSPWGTRDMFAVGLPATITDAAAHQLIAGQNDVFLDLVMLLISNTSTATNSRVDVSDGTNTYPFMSIGGAGPVGFSSGLILPASKKGTDWTITAAGAVTDLRVISLFVRNK